MIRLRSRRAVLAAAATLLCFVAVAPARAQQAAAARVSPHAAVSAASLAAMRPLGWLVGEWEGTGWMARGRERFTVLQRETVRWGAGGGVLVIDGLGTSTDSATAGNVVHQAFATIVWDSVAAAHQLHSYRAGGGPGADRPVVEDGRLVWGLSVPGGRARFTVTRTAAGEWHEVGDFVRAGEPADARGYRFMEMTLRKK
jgi:hypothetical protein